MEIFSIKMAIEIREINIKTEVRSQVADRTEQANEKELQQLRDQLLDECKRMILGKTKKKQYKR